MDTEKNRREASGYGLGPPGMHVDTLRSQKICPKLPAICAAHPLHGEQPITTKPDWSKFDVCVCVPVALPCLAFVTDVVAQGQTSDSTNSIEQVPWNPNSQGRYHDTYHHHL